MGSFRGVINISQNPILTASEKFNINVPKQIISPEAFLSFSRLSYSTRAEGNYYRCTFSLHAPDDYLNLLFHNNLMRHVIINSPQGKILWEGFIYEMSLQLPRVMKRISVQTICNRIWVRYQVIGSATVSRTAVVENLESQARYGIRETVLTAGETRSNLEALQLAGRILEQNRIPKVMTDDLTIGGAPKSVVLNIVCYGYYETLKWQMYNQTALTGVQSVSSQINDIILANVQFYKSIDLGLNATPVARVYDMDRTAESIMKSNAALGDAYYRRWLIRYMPEFTISFNEAAPPEYPPA